MRPWTVKKSKDGQFEVFDAEGKKCIGKWPTRALAKDHVTALEKEAKHNILADAYARAQE